MTTIQILLGLSVIASGLFTGLLVAVVALLQQTLKPLSASEFTVVMRHFLPVAPEGAGKLRPRPHPDAGSAHRPGPGLGADGNSLVQLNPGGLAGVYAGPFLASRFAAEPLYDVIPGWPVQSPPADWQVTRDRYFLLNLVRLIGSGLAFLLFLLALSMLFAL